MSRTWIVDASAIIIPAKAGCLTLLNDLAGTILVPDAVFQEILAGPKNDPARQALETGWGQQASPSQIPTSVLEWGLGNGETAVIALALEQKGAMAVLDDDAGRMCARSHNLPVIGTLGIVLRAKKRGIIPSAAEVMKRLVQADFYISDALLENALQSVGETWTPIH